MAASMAIAAPKTSQGSADVLRAIWAIVQDGRLKAGDQLPSIRELADQLDVKPTAVRDALLQAQTMGLVKVLPRAGAFLQAASPMPRGVVPALEAVLSGIFPIAWSDDEFNLFHLLDARRLVEIELVGRAAERRRLEELLPLRRALDAMLNLRVDTPRADYVELDIRFHMEIARLAGNLVLLSVQRTLMELLRPHLNDVPYDLQRRGTTDRSHVAIYESLVAADSDRARAEMREHLSLAFDGLLRDIQAPPTAGEVGARISR